MSQIWTRFLAEVQRQGFAIMLLVAATIYFHFQNAELKKEITECNRTQLEYWKSERIELVKVLADVKTALKENTRALRKDPDE